jgi:hypothetical protein
MLKYDDYFLGSSEPINEERVSYDPISAGALKIEPKNLTISNEQS